MINAITNTLFFLLFCLVAGMSQRAEVYYVELAGANLGYSVNYDTRFKEGTDGGGMRIGFGVLPTDEGVVFGIPIHLNTLIGKKNHKLELGLGVSTFFARGEDLENLILLSGTIMYRSQTIGKHLNFRFGLSPIFTPADEFGYLFRGWLGISIGYGLW